MEYIEFVPCPGAEEVRKKKRFGFAELAKVDVETSFGLCRLKLGEAKVRVERCTAMDKDGKCSPFSETDRKIVGIKVATCPLRIREKKPKIKAQD